jgi:hypothetical protein
VIDDEYYQYLYGVRVNGYNRNMEPTKKSSLHNLSDKLHGVLDRGIMECQIIVKILPYLGSEYHLEKMIDKT